MKLQLGQFDEFPVTVTLVATPSEIAPERITNPEILAVKGLTAKLSVQKAEAEYFCQGEVVAELTIECARCLAPFERKLAEPLDFIAAPLESKAAHESGREIDSEDYVYYSGNDVSADIFDQVEQTLVLAIDLKPLCREDCAGLCQSCGKNLNDGPCGCVQEKVDPRLEVLSKVREQLLAEEKASDTKLTKASGTKRKA
jgi:uncharacterized protein